MKCDFCGRKNAEWTWAKMGLYLCRKCREIAKMSVMPGVDPVGSDPIVIDAR